MLPLKIKKKKIPKKKRPFCKLTIQLSLKQKELLDIYCKQNEISINKFIRQAIYKATEGVNTQHYVKGPLQKSQVDLEDLIRQISINE